MNSLAVIQGGGATAVTESLFFRFVEFMDAKPKTIETYTRALRQFFRFLSLRGIARPTREDVIAFRNELRGRCKPGTIQLYIIAVRQFFKWTAQAGLFPNVAENIKGAKLDREHKKDHLTSAQAKDVLDGIDQGGVQGLRDYAILALMLTTGLRTIEVARSNIEDLRTVGDGAALYIQGKGRDEKTEYVKLASPAERAVRTYLKAAGTPDKGQPLFRSLSNQNKAQRLTTRSISRIVKTCLQAAGYDDDRLTAHSLRHTAVTLALMRGETLQDVQRFARHSSMNTTVIYAHNIDMAKNSCSNSIASALFERGAAPSAG
jgi:integrase/recombinase XerC